ncbi:MAG: tetratricopeptide repeat protein [Flavobacteriales bacterium]|nr:tetratricopeptide repeat protein [Flavobacteriales bacterium]
MRSLVAFVLLLGPVQFANAQTNLDSLYAVWLDESHTDSVRLAAYKVYVLQGFAYSKPDTVEVLVAALHRYAEEHDYPKAAAEGFNIQGNAYLVRGDVPHTLEYFQKALAIRESIGDNLGIAGSLGNIGLTYSLFGYAPLALEYLQKARAMSEEFGYHSIHMNALIAIGQVYTDQQDLPQALEYLEKALVIAEEGGYEGQIATIEGQIANVYGYQGDQTRSLEYNERALAHMEKSGNRVTAAQVLSNMAESYRDQGDFARATEHFEAALAIQRELGLPWGIATSLAGIGTIHLDQGNERLAQPYCEDALFIAKENGIMDIQTRACRCLYRYHQLSGNSTKALEYLERYIVLKDSLLNTENTKKLAQMEMQYTFDKKEAATQAEQEKKDAVAAEEMEKQKLVRNGFMGGFAVVLLFAGVFLTQRNRIGKEKARSEELLLNILPEEVAEELKAKGSAEAVHIDQVTVLFTDFKGFTAMSEVLSPKDLVNDLNLCFSEFDMITSKHGIEKIKTIGDAYMAAGGLPTPNTTHATDVINAALEMRDFIAEGKARKVAAGLPFFEIRVGIHTGPVVAGIVGVKKFQYDIWGDTVNIASRMESSGEVGQVNISEATYALVKDEPGLAFTPRGKVQAKGKGEMEMYFVGRT